MIKPQDEFNETFEKIIIYAIEKGDQKLWDILYPYIISTNYELGKCFIKHFAYKLNP